MIIFYDIIIFLVSKVDQKVLSVICAFLYEKKRFLQCESKKMPKFKMNFQNMYDFELKTQII